MADDRVLPLLPPLLGAKFFAKKKQPIPVTLSTKDFRHELVRARDSTYFFQAAGPCWYV
jgi:ribosome biogenesis protein UTP30